MSSERHSTSFARETRLGSRGGLRPHAHPFHQFTWAPGGSVCIGADGASWLLSRGVALWIPAGVAHDVVAERTAVMRSLYFVPDRCPVPWTGVTPVHATGLVGGLFDHLVELPLGDHRDRVERVLFDLLEPVPAVTVELPQLRDDRLRRVAGSLAANPADSRTLEEWGRHVGASGRTLARVMRSETGMTFAAWRAQLRFAYAAQRLAAGARVTEAAIDSGYATPSAFVAAFRRVVGVSPGAYTSAQRERPATPSSTTPAVTIIPPNAIIDVDVRITA